MLCVMSENRVRTVLVIPEEIRAALRLESAKRQEDMSDIASEILEITLAESLAEIRRLRQSGAEAKPKRGKS
jgi:hypothetical protein